MINMSEYAKRRKTLMQKIGPDGIVILSSAPELLRNGDAVYAYRQNSDFYYLTGFDEPESVLVLAPKRKDGEFILFNRVRDRDHEIWDGPRAGQEGAIKTFKADQAFPIHELNKMLPELLAGRETIHYTLGKNREFDKTLLQAVNQARSKVRSGIQAPTTFIDIAPSLHEMRLFKSAAEIAVMQKAVDITEKAHVRAMQVCKPGMNEYQLEAEILYEFQRHGARFPAYNSIVGAGRHSCILHYVHNNQKIANGDVVLIDAGAEYQNYAADITRTFPANGKFSGEQKAIYELVLASQLAAIKSIKPGASWTKAQDVIVKIITQGLIDLKILKGNLDTLIEKQAYFPFYMHRSGHWLGLDVHDVGRYRIDKKWRNLQPGMMLTVEPGIYISADTPHVPARWHNIGVRIEDNVLVTKEGCRVLSQAIPKTVKDIEAIMAD
jgi:Xaa-Pro aminopeptidase